MFMEFEKGEKFARNGAAISDTCEHYQDAGYVLKENDLIIDIDDLPKDIIKRMITLFNIKTQIVWTERGVHLYYKKPDNLAKYKNKISSAGFPIEVKHAANTKAITIKRNGNLREIENEGVREDVPSLFSVNKKFDNVLGYGEGDGRNEVIFKHRHLLGNVDGWERILRFTNEDIFSIPLEENEFQTLTRDMEIIAEKDAEPQLAEMFMRKLKIVKFEGTLYFKHNDYYVADDDLLTRIIFEQVGDQKTRYVDEILKQIEYRCKVIDSDTEFDIVFSNGILRKGHFIEIDYDDFTPYRIDVEYHQDAKPVKEVDDYLNHLTKNDLDYINVILEIMAHCLIVDKDFKRLLAKFFIFVGGGGNGKGTLLTIMKEILGRKNVSGMSISNMKDERYLMSLKGKLANLGDDIQDEPIDGEMMKNLKNISTCDMIEGRMLYKQSESITLSASLIFTSNHILKSFEKGAAYKRRVMWLPMYSVVQDKDKDINFISKLTSPAALEYWVSLVIKGYFRLYNNSKFTQADAIINFNKEYHEENDSTLIFLSDYEAEHIAGLRPPVIYDEYEAWCEENGMNVGSKKMLQQSIDDIFDMVSKVVCREGKSERIYMVNVKK